MMQASAAEQLLTSTQQTPAVQQQRVETSEAQVPEAQMTAASQVFLNVRGS